MVQKVVVQKTPATEATAYYMEFSVNETIQIRYPQEDSAGLGGLSTA